MKTVSPKKLISCFGGVSLSPGQKYKFKVDKTDGTYILAQVVPGVSVRVKKSEVNFN